MTTFEAVSIAFIVVVLAVYLRIRIPQMREGWRRGNAAIDRAIADIDTGRPKCSHGVLLSEGPCPLCAATPKGPPHCGYWCELTPAGRCRYRCVELMAGDQGDPT